MPFVGLVFFPVRLCLLFKSPDLYVLHIEILLFREHGVPKCFTGVTPAMVEVSIQPQAKLTTKGKEDNFKWEGHKLLIFLEN